MTTKKEMKVLATCRLWLRKNADRTSTAILWDAVSELYGEPHTVCTEKKSTGGDTVTPPVDLKKQE